MNMDLRDKLCMICGGSRLVGKYKTNNIAKINKCINLFY